MTKRVVQGVPTRKGEPMSAAIVNVGSLYSGIGGLEIGVFAAFAEAGILTKLAWQIERDPFCVRVLAHHFPHVTRYGDVASVSGPQPVDVMVGGFACQDVSAAGLGRGLGIETRSGNTWHHFTRIIRETRPRAVVVENVASGAKRWIPRIVSDLRAAGYRPYAVPVGAVHVGAPHRRLRVFVVAYREGERSEPLAHGHGHGLGREGEPRGVLLDEERAALGDDADGCGGEACSGTLSDAARGQLRRQPGRRRGPHGAGAGEPGDDGSARTSEPGLGVSAHGLPFDVVGHCWPAARGQEQHPWEPPRTVSGKKPARERPAKLRALGNAVVPQCALVVGRVLVALGAPW